MAPGARSKFNHPMFEPQVFRKQKFCIEVSFQTAKNRTQRNRRAKGCEDFKQTRTVVGKFLLRGLYICVGRRDILKI